MGLSQTQRGGSRHIAAMFILVPSHQLQGQKIVLSTKCGTRKFLQGTLFCKMHCVLHSFLAYMVFLRVVSRTDPGISLKYSRPAGNKTNDIWNKKDCNSKLIFSQMPRKTLYAMFVLLTKKCLILVNNILVLMLNGTNLKGKLYEFFPLPEQVSWYRRKVQGDCWGIWGAPSWSS